jgi:hypothetical protein
LNLSWNFGNFPFLSGFRIFYFQNWKPCSRPPLPKQEGRLSCFLHLNYLIRVLVWYFLLCCLLRACLAPGHKQPHHLISWVWQKKLSACSFGWWLMAGADLFWEKITVGWLLMAGLFWEKSTTGWWLISQANRAYGVKHSTMAKCGGEPNMSLVMMLARSNAQAIT